MQVGALTVVLPMLVMPVTLELLSSACMQAVPPAAMLAAVALAVIVGAAVMNSELNASRCCMATVTRNLIGHPRVLPLTGQVAS